MMNILQKITAHKNREVAQRKSARPVADLEKSSYFERDVLSLRLHLLRPDKSGIITEFKRHSPSKGDINTDATVKEVTTGYASAGASGLSVLTDEQFFKGKNADLTAAREVNNIPVLRKDFIVDEYQIIEAKAIGADAILLIAECLEKAEVARLARFAKSLGLEILMEVHSERQLDKITTDLDIIGVNNRNLETFEVSIDTSLALFDKIPSEFVRISESGISDVEAILTLKAAGFQGFLIGEHFMQDKNPAEKARKFIAEIAARSSVSEKV